jgi:SAM-dependent methyltransferase
LKNKIAGFFKWGFRKILPLSFRKSLAVWADRQEWLPGRHELPLTILRDWADKDADAFHRFLWTNHLVYARWYEKSNEFGPENLRITRRMLFQDIGDCLLRNGINPSTDVKSVFDVGCSSGFLLRYMETNVFPAANILEGNDIDGPAIARGEAYLKDHGSKIHLMNADMAKLEQIMNGSKYDVVFCSAVLVYLHESAAAEVVKSMLNHCNCLVAIYSIAHPSIDNSKLEYSETRSSDGVFFHNIDKMVENAGGKIVYRRWEGSKTYADGQTIYFVFSQPKA